MSLKITPEIEEILQTIFLTGHYKSKADVLHEALDLLRQRDRLRLDIHQGLRELDRGEGVEGDEVFRDLEQKAAQMAEPEL